MTASAAKRAKGLASPKAGAVKNPASQAARWRLLEEAMAIDRAAALQSVSWGIGQVMGSHWKALGYDSVEALVAEARDRCFGGQVRLMLRFLEANGLIQRSRHMTGRRSRGPITGRATRCTAMTAASPQPMRATGGKAAAARLRRGGLARRPRRGGCRAAAHADGGRLSAVAGWPVRPGDGARGGAVSG
jgi:hypothetical protein